MCLTLNLNGRLSLDYSTILRSYIRNNGYMEYVDITAVYNSYFKQSTIIKYYNHYLHIGLNNDLFLSKSLISGGGIVLFTRDMFRNNKYFTCIKYLVV